MPTENAGAVSTGAALAVRDPVPPQPVQAEVAQPPAPVTAADRVGSVDLLRGFALCGILVMNIMEYAWPTPAYFNPTLGAGFDGVNKVAWYFSHLFFELKMMTLFSMLFGAGLVLQADRAANRGATLRGASGVR